MELTPFNIDIGDNIDDFLPGISYEIINTYPVEYEIEKNENNKINMVQQNSTNSELTKELKDNNIYLEMNSDNLQHVQENHKSTLPNHNNAEPELNIQEDNSLNDMIVRYPQTFGDNLKEVFESLKISTKTIRQSKLQEILKYGLKVTEIEIDMNIKNAEAKELIKDKIIVIKNEIENLISNKNIDDESNNKNDDQNYEEFTKYIFNFINNLLDIENKNHNYKQIFYKINDTENISEKQLAEYNKPQIIGPNGTKVSGKLLRSIDWNKSSDATRKLLMEIFDRKTLSTHTIKEIRPLFVYPRRKIKDQLDPSKVADIIFRVRLQSEASEHKIRVAISTKCTDEYKMRRYKERKRLESGVESTENLGYQIKVIRLQEIPESPNSERNIAITLQRILR